MSGRARPSWRDQLNLDERLARHEPYLGGDNVAFAGADSTNVASHPEFSDRKKSVALDGVALNGWFAR